MLNQFTAIGYLAADPELKQINPETKVANFRMGIDGGKLHGEKVTEWINCVSFGTTAENLTKYLKNGSKAYISGRLSTRKYQKDGVDKYITEIIANKVLFLDPRPEQRHIGGEDFTRPAARKNKCEDDFLNARGHADNMDTPF